MSANAGTSGKGGLSDFDRLPAGLRQALRDYPLCLDVGFALKQLRSGTSEKRLQEMLEQRKAVLSEFNPENRKRELGHD